MIFQFEIVFPHSFEAPAEVIEDTVRKGISLLWHHLDAERPLPGALTETGIGGLRAENVAMPEGVYLRAHLGG